MGAIAYLDFDLQILRIGTGYRVQVLDSPGGQASSEFSLPFSSLELENFLLRMGRRRLAVRGADQPEMEATKKFGGTLFSAVFRDEVLACWRTSLDEAARRQAGLRVRLRLTDAPELADLPWEYLYNPARKQFLTLSATTPVVRYLEMSERIRPLEVQPPLRVLVMISSPSNYPRLAVEQEWTRLRTALEKPVGLGQLELERLEGGTLTALQHCLRLREFHIFHFIGHAYFDPKAQDGFLIFEDDDDHGRAVSGQDLGVLLHDHFPMRLAVLNACEGARASLTDPFAGAAQSLTLQGLPAVIAMQFEITDEAAIVFAQEFYAAVADGYPVDAALAESRKAISNRGYGPEWGTPVLYLRAHDGRIFDVQRGGMPLPPPSVKATQKPVPAPPVETEAKPLVVAPTSTPPPLLPDRTLQKETPPIALRPPPQPIKDLAGPAHTAQKPDVTPAPLPRPSVDSSWAEALKRARVVRIAAAAVLLATILIAVKMWPPRKNSEPSQFQVAPASGGSPLTPPVVKKEPASEQPPITNETPSHPVTPPAKKPVRVAGNVLNASLLSKVQPEYPPLAKQAHVQGTVSLEAIIARDGTVKELKYVSGPPLLVNSALEAVRQWRYKPMLLHGEPVEVSTTIDVLYTLNESAPATGKGSAEPVTSATLGGAKSVTPAPPAGVTPDKSVTADAAATGKSAPASTSPCTLGEVELKNQGFALIGSVPYTYQGGYALETVAVRGVALKANKQRVSGLTYSQSTLKATSGSAAFSIEGHPSLSHPGEESEYLLVAIVVKATGEIVCGQTLPYHRKW